ncbi:MAG: dihydroneopterin aldolase [Bacteroidia bacterium]|nr:dihydroneopterin aldolase [Bacteroidia bacterium]MCX7651957.1 dihydroneopterin aldolase [Bacteroidia bacterium]MDW8416108.1 dihydroneopterin aldolase [Bacteroidia bacterium]
MKGIEVYGHIGYFPEERKMGRLFRLDIDAEYVAPEVGATPPIDYREIAHMIKERFVSEGVLIEHLAEEIAVAIFNRWNTVEKVRIAVHKVHPPVGILAESAYAYVEMERP